MRTHATRSRIVVVFVALALLAVSCGGSDGGVDNAERRDSAHDVTVMTRNLYLGADLTPLFEATPATLNAAARATYDQVTSSRVEDRLDDVAAEIAEVQPDIVALQEATLWRVQPPGASEPTVLYDFVTILLERLEHRGATYSVAATADGFDGGLPIEGVGTVTMQDRDVILVRRTPGVSVTDPARGTFVASLTVSVAGAPIEVRRGWASIDAAVGGRTFRVVATHLEAFDATVRDAQQRELLAIIDESPVPTMLLGDLNSTPTGEGSAAYMAALAAGFSDSWSAVNSDGAGSTCCRAADLEDGALSERIDYVLFRGDFDVVVAEVIGTGDISRTPSGLWASDHAGVVATLTVPP